jgi:hypothetical protein
MGANSVITKVLWNVYQCIELNTLSAIEPQTVSHIDLQLFGFDFWNTEPKRAFGSTTQSEQLKFFMTRSAQTSF